MLWASKPRNASQKRRAVEVFFPLKPRNPSRQPAARLGERKTPGRRRMRLGVRLSQLAALTDRIPPALPWESPRCPARTAHTAPTARARQWAKEQIRAELLSQHKTRCHSTSVALGFPEDGAGGAAAAVSSPSGGKRGTGVALDQSVWSSRPRHLPQAGEG